MKLFVSAIALVALGGCHWKDEAEQFKQKWVEETRHHHQTQLIKSAEIEQLAKENAALRKENENLKAKLAGR